MSTSEKRRLHILTESQVKYPIRQNRNQDISPEESVQNHENTLTLKSHRTKNWHSQDIMRPLHASPQIQPRLKCPL